MLIAEVPRETRFGHSSTVLSAVLSARDSLYHKKLHRQDNQSIVVRPLKMGNWGRRRLKSELPKLYRKSVVGPWFLQSTVCNHMLLLACSNIGSFGTEGHFSIRTVLTDAMWFAFSVIWLNFLQVKRFTIRCITAQSQSLSWSQYSALWPGGNGRNHLTDFQEVSKDSIPQPKDVETIKAVIMIAWKLAGS